MRNASTVLLQKNVSCVCRPTAYTACQYIILFCENHNTFAEYDNDLLNHIVFEKKFEQFRWDTFY